MTDVPDGSGQIPRRSPRVSDGAAPVSGGLAIVLAIVAVVAGFLILRSISDSGATSADFPDPGGLADDGSGNDDSAGGTTVPDDTAPTLPTTTTEPPIVTEGASVIVANANGLPGSAGAMTRAIETGAGFSTVDPTDASSAIDDLAESVIYYDPTDPEAQAVAESLARVVGGVGTISPLDGNAPTADGTLGGAQVLFMLGLDKANKTLDELVPASGTGDVVTVTNPDPTGSTVAPEG